jgi:hypothetical protein
MESSRGTGGVYLPPTRSCRLPVQAGAQMSTMDALSRFLGVGEAAGRAALRTWLPHPAVLPEVRETRPYAAVVVAPLANRLGGQARIVQFAASCIAVSLYAVSGSELAGSVAQRERRWDLTDAEALALPSVLTGFASTLTALGRRIEGHGVPLDGRAPVNLLALAQMVLLAETDEVLPNELAERLLVVPPGAFTHDGSRTTVSTRHASREFRKALNGAAHEVAARSGRGYLRQPRPDAAQMRDAVVRLVRDDPEFSVEGFLDEWYTNSPRVRLFVRVASWTEGDPPDRSTLYRYLRQVRPSRSSPARNVRRLRGRRP